MRNSFKIIFFLFIYMCVTIQSTYIYAQVPSTEGKEFFLSFMQNGYRSCTGSSSYEAISCIISARRSCSGTISNPNTNWSINFNVAANGITNITIPYNYAYSTNSEVIENLGLVVSSTDTISLYIANEATNSFDAANVLPTGTLGDNYIIQCYDPSSKSASSTCSGNVKSAFIIIATENNTIVDITPSCATSAGKAANSTITVTLKRGQSYQVISKNRGTTGNLSGSVVKARNCKKIAVFNGNILTGVPITQTNGYDHIFEQAMPPMYWGNKFAITGSKTRKGDFIRVTAANNNTQIKINGTLQATINARNTYEFFLSDSSCYIETSEPSAVYLYQTTSEYDNSTDGDPSMVWITPVEQQMKEITFGTFTAHNTINNHYVNIVTSTSDLSSITLDGINIGNQFRPLTGNPALSYAQVDIPHGTHTIRSNTGFTAHVYGFGYVKGYAYTVGSSAVPLTGNIMVNGTDILSSSIANSKYYCLDDTLGFKLNVNYEYTSVQWNLGNGTVIQAGDTTSSPYKNPGLYTIRAIVKLKFANCEGNLYDTIQGYLNIVGVRDTIRDTTCYNTNYIKHGFNIHALNDTIAINIAKDRYGCDSITTLYLSIADTCILTFYDTITLGGSYAKHGFNLPPDSLNYIGTSFYSETYLNRFSCDSTHQLYLTVVPTYLFEDTIILCQHTDSIWRNFVLETSSIGDYIVWDSLKTVIWNSDSIYKLNLTVNPVYYFYDTIISCQDANVSWHDKQLTTSSAGEFIFYDSLKTADCNCDSIHKLNLIVKPTYFFNDTLITCQNATVNWHNQLINTPDTGTFIFWDSLTTYDYSCDSIHMLSLVVKPTYLFNDTLITCQNATVTWHNKSINTPDTGTFVFWDSLTTSDYSCDSIYMLSLVVKPTYLLNDTLTTCQNSTVTWHNQLINTPNAGTFIFWDSLTTKDHGCDSIHKLNLIVTPTYFFNDTLTACQNATIEWHNQQLPTSTSGSYIFWDSLTTKDYGCDSIHKLHFTVTLSYFFNDTLITCQNSTINWHNQLINTPDTGTFIFWDSLTAQNYSCDSVHMLTLIVKPTYFINDTLIACQNSIDSWHNKPLPTTTAGTFILWDSLKTVDYGCDSIHKLNLIVTPTYFFNDTIITCQNATGNWHNQQLPTSATGTFILWDSLTTTDYGCDSIYKLNLIVTPTYFFNDTLITCQNSIANWHNKLLATSTAGTFIAWDSLTTKDYGCDSIYKLNLIVTPTYFFNDTIITCQNSTVNWHNKTINTPNAGTFIFWDSLTTNDYNCDSIYKLNLVITPTYFFNDTIITCQNATGNWHNQQLPTATPGMFILWDSLTTTDYGCDSIYKLSLIVTPVYFFNDTLTTCQNATINWHSKPINTSIAGTFIVWDSLTTKDYGCDSIYKLNLTVTPTYFFNDTLTTCQNSTISWHNQQINTPNAGTFIFWDSLTTNDYSCDSIYKLNLIVKPTYFFNDTLITCQNATGNWHNQQLPTSTPGTFILWDSLTTTDYSCDSIYKLSLIVTPVYSFNDTLTTCQNSTVNWHNRQLPTATPGIFILWDSLSTKGYGCDSIYKLNLTVTPTYFFNDTLTTCQNSTINWHNQQINTPNAGTFIFWDSLTTNDYNCDSIYKLNLIVKPTYFFNDTLITCQNATVSWHNRQLQTATPGIFILWDSLSTKGYGCDSIYKLNLIVAPIYSFNDTLTTCQNSTVRWHNRQLPTATPGIFILWDSLSTKGYGCDSIYKLNLTVTPTYFFNDTLTTCQNSTISWHNRQINTPNTGTFIYWDSLTTKDYNCDSIYKLNLIVKPTYFFNDTLSVCQYTSADWHNIELPTAKFGTFTYWDSLKTVNYNYDSIYRLTFVVNHTPELKSAIPNDTLCSGTRTSSIAFNGTASSYEWFAEGDVIGSIPTEAQTGSFKSYAVENKSQTILTTKITVTPKSKYNNTLTCTGEADNFSISVYPETYINAVVNDSLFCEGSDIKFDILNHEELSNFQWSGPDDFSSFIYNPVIENASVKNSGVYTIEATTIDNCPATSATLTVSVLPSVILDLEDTVYICNSDATISPNATNADHYIWNTKEMTENITVSSPGTYWVIAYNKRCQAADTTNVVERQIPDFKIDTIGNVCEDGSMQLYVDVENADYNWLTGETTDYITIYQSGLYGVYVSMMGCTTLQNINIECPCSFWVPNVFTPNDDGVNDTFIPIPMSALNTFSMQIYDRWGSMIFRTETYSAWDGTYNGKYASMGAYSYVIYYSCLSSPNEMRKMQGSISLIR